MSLFIEPYLGGGTDENSNDDDGGRNQGGKPLGALAI
jgi:hypothetical protein